MIRIFFFPLITLTAGLLLNFAQQETYPIAHSRVYPEQLTGAFTGGFGEQTCRNCHFDYDLNPKEGNLSISGIPDTLSEGQIIKIIITVEREKLGRAGFQLSARYADGRQAGEFDIKGSNRIMFSKDVSDSLQYVQHSQVGSEVIKKNKNRWSVKWKAPASLSKPVFFNIAANAANGDQSEFGDFIYAQEKICEF